MVAHPQNTSTWKETAWNGVRFKAPVDWDLSRIGARYLMLENEAGPVLEVKWAPIKGAFSHTKHLRRLAKSFQRQSGIRIEEFHLPPDWKKNLKKYDVSGFLWTGKTVRGKGVILYCPDCKHATLIQFYDYPIRKSENVYLKILSSFKDHRLDNEAVWAVFDIRAVIPDTYDLKYHRFEPGRFELSFASDKQKLTLYRWGPAAVALSDRTLEQFAKMMIPILQAEDRFHIRTDGNVVDFESEDSGEKSPFRSFFKRRNTVMKVRVWHEETKNKILGIRLEENGSTGTVMLDTLSKRYETLS